MGNNTSMELKPTLEQRLILVNQYKILEKLYPEDAEMYAQYQEILNNGYTLHYGDLTDYMSEPMKLEEQEFVLNILDLYSTMNLAVYRSKNEKYKGKTIYFPGFDGNHESKYIGYARFFIFRLNRFEDLKKEDTYESYNSHGSTLNTYQKMLDYWNTPLVENENKFDLSDEKLDWLIEHSVWGTLGDKNV